jgi:predicted permease
VLEAATAAARAIDPWSARFAAAATADSMAGWGATESSRNALSLLGNAVALVFLGLCANVAALVLARFNARRRQFALCSALGASRRRLLGQAIVETAVLVGTGTAAGCLTAWGLVRAARDLLPRAFLARSLHPVEIGWSTFGVAAGLAIVAATVAGLAPGWVSTRVEMDAASLRLVERGSSEGKGVRAWTRLLSVVEIALACTLMAGMSLLVRTFVNLTRIEQGFDTNGLTVVELQRQRPSAAAPPPPAQAFAETGELLRRLPGVERVTWSNGAPATAFAELHFGSDWQSDVPGSSPVSLEAEGSYISRDFFDVYGIGLLRGRGFQPGDSADRVVIDERVAGVLFPGGGAVGHSFLMGKTRLEVIGVARTVHRLMIERDRDFPMIYWPFEAAGRQATLSMRCRGVCPSEGVIRRALLDAPAGLSVKSVQQAADVYEDDLSEPRLTAAVAAIFAVISLLAAAGGLFGLLSHAVGRRRREFGIRTALGASAREIGAMVLREGAGVAVVGLALGSTGAWLLSRAIASVQYGVSLDDPVTWVPVIGALAAAILLASWRPARAAMRVDPVDLLREE